MSFRMQLQIEKKPNQIMGVRDEIRLLKLLRTEIQTGAMADVFHAVPVMLRIAAIMTAVVGKNITGLDVACKLEQMRRSFEDFMWFKSLPGVHYDVNINRVTVLPEYWDKYDLPTDESPDFFIFRLKGEPRYRLFYEVYTEGGVGRLDVQWIISRLDGGHPKWLPRLISDYWWWQP